MSKSSVFQSVSTTESDLPDLLADIESSEANAAASATSAAASAASTGVAASTATQEAANAASSAAAAANSATAAANSETAAGNSETAAGNSATAANNSATTASGHATTANSAAGTASGHASDALSHKTDAETAETNALASQTAAAASATAAGNSETAAGNSETAAANSATAAGNSATAAGNSATAAGNSETNAANSATAAGNSATAAGNSATAAANSATDASNHATTAQGHKNSALAAQTAAESARDSALSAYDNFDDRYLGVKTSNPSTDNDGDALVAGTLYFNSTDGSMKLYTGSSWVDSYVSGGSFAALSGATFTGDIAINSDLTVDSGTLFVDAATNRVGINLGSGVSPTVPLNVAGTVRFQSTSSAGQSVELTNYSGVSKFYRANGRLEFQAGNTGNDELILSNTGGLTFGGNDVLTSASTIDAATLDGVDSTSFLRSDANDTMTGDLTISGNALISTTSSDPRNFTGGTSGVKLGGDQPEFAVGTMYINRSATADGDIISFRKEASTIGSIETHGGKLQIGQGNANVQFSNADDAIIPTNGNGTVNNNAIDLGTNSAKFNDLHLGGNISSVGVNLDGGTNHNTHDATLHVTAADNSDWGIKVSADSGKTDYGLTLRMPNSFNNAFTVYKNGTQHVNIDSTGIIVGSGSDYVWHAGNDGAGSGLDADLLDGYDSAENGGNKILRTASNGYIQIQDWINVGSAGLYSSTTNGAHFRPNTATSYATWRTDGSRGGYDGILFDDGGQQSIMFDSSRNGGIYAQNGGRWVIYHNYSNNCLGVGHSATSSSYELYVSGDIYATGNITAYSDARAKENVETIDGALGIVEQMRGVYYNKIDNPDKTREMGFLAQEVNAVEGASELVTYAEDIDQYSVMYGNTAALLVEAVKELSAEVKELKAEVEELKNASSN